MKKLIIISLLFVFSCKNQNNNFIDYKRLRIISKEIKSYKLNEVSSVCTKEGFKSILEWSDSLRDVQFLNSLSTDLASNKITFSYMEKDTSYIVYIGEYSSNVQDTHGALILKFENKELKINGYMGR